jgi:hypothetical protein
MAGMPHGELEGIPWIFRHPEFDFQEEAFATRPGEGCRRLRLCFHSLTIVESVHAPESAALASALAFTEGNPAKRVEQAAPIHSGGRPRSSTQGAGMGRLVKPVAGNDRFYLPLFTPFFRRYLGDANRGMKFQDQGESDLNKYLERMAKYIPAEIISAYLLVDSALYGRFQLSAAFMAICLASIVPYMMKLKKHGDSLPVNIGVSMFSFAIWSFCLEGSFFKMSLAEVDPKDIVTYKSFAVGIYLIACGLIPGKKD